MGDRLPRTLTGCVHPRDLQRAAGRHITRRRGVTLPEVLVVIGLIVILVGLFVPVVAKARAGTREVTLLADARRYVAGITVVADDNQGRTVPYTPRGDYAGTAARLDVAMFLSYRVLVDAGVYRSWEEIDRVGHEVFGTITLMSSATLYAAPGEFRLDAPRHYAGMEATGVQLARATNPSMKGAVWQVRTGTAPGDIWCCGSLWNRGAIGMLDGSAGLHAAAEFEWPDGVRRDRQMGVPVVTTLGGIRGTDRLR